MKRWFCGLVIAAALGVSPFALAGDLDDTVHLANGGRVRGVVLQDEPNGALVIRLPDGTTRSIPRGDVRSVDYGSKAGTATPPTTLIVHLEANDARVTLD